MYIIQNEVQFPTKKTKLVLVDPEHGCETPRNSNQIKGNVAFVKRGFVFIVSVLFNIYVFMKFKINVINSDCSFLKKTVISESSGAKAIIITDNNIFDDSAYIQMVHDESELSANIPAGFLVGKSG